MTLPIIVRLREDVGKLPAGFSYEFPNQEALALVRRRKAVIVGNLSAVPDIVVTEDELPATGLDAALWGVTSN